MILTDHCTHCVIHFACNDHRNGIFQGYVTSLEFDFWRGKQSVARCQIDSPYADAGLRMRFACSIDRPRPTPNRIVLGDSKIILPFTGWHEWVGNWCWDAGAFTVRDGVRLMKCLRRSGWSMDSADSRLWRMWERARTRATT